MAMDTRYFFVYGSLRPDDDSGQPWTKTAVSGLNAQRARLSRARMYHDYNYACIVLDSEEFSSKDCITGYVLSTNDDRLFREKLQLFDQIEGYRGPNSSHNYYDRAVVDVELLDKENPSKVKAYVYHGTHVCKRKNLIPSGDWLQRNRER